MVTKNDLIRNRIAFIFSDLHYQKVILWSLFFWSRIFAGCHADEKRIGIQQYIPDLKHGKSELLEGARPSRDSLGLDNLEKGYDSLQIRIWFGYGRKDSFQVLSIKRNNKQWQGFFCLATFELNYIGDSIARYSRIIFQPKTGADWGIIVDSLVSLHIMTLPDECKVIDIDAFPFEGGNSVIIEVADVHQYRIYMYELPSYFKGKSKEAADVDKMIHFLSERIGIHYLAVRLALANRPTGCKIPNLYLSIPGKHPFTDAQPQKPPAVLPNSPPFC